ncbi:hypothetical protein OnM2_087023 [Erysiphe neolycopersici]|uniref:Uncharacterized protein n=1 Tax=Erysiphe neolycopersici TaxID=212602 RepID=A0A420HE63_9PEZI|nr:hypothetical protein OnM2_087023 [Erysiphe neolycopersici]
MTRLRRKCAVTSNSDIETKQSSSLEDEKDMIETAQRITKNIRNKKRKAIEDDFNRRQWELKLKIEKQFETRQKAITKYQNDTWEKLEVLNEKLQFIEESILSTIKNLESLTLNMTNQMILILRESIYDHQRVGFGALEN